MGWDEIAWQKKEHCCLLAVGCGRWEPYEKKRLCHWFSVGHRMRRRKIKGTTLTCWRYMMRMFLGREKVTHWHLRLLVIAWDVVRLPAAEWKDTQSVTDFLVVHAMRWDETVSQKGSTVTHKLFVMGFNVMMKLPGRKTGDCHWLPVGWWDEPREIACQKWSSVTYKLFVMGFNMMRLPGRTQGHQCHWPPVVNGTRWDETAWQKKGWCHSLSIEDENIWQEKDTTPHILLVC